MLNKESQQQQPVLKQYPQRCLYKQNSYKQFFRVTKREASPPNGIIATTNGKLSPLNKHNDAIISKINGHQIKDLQKSANCKLNLRKNSSVENKAMRNSAITSDSNCNCSKSKAHINGSTDNGFTKRENIDTEEKYLLTLSNGEIDHNHRKKNVKLKESNGFENEEKINVCKASQRLDFLRSMKPSSVPPNNMMIEKLLELQDTLIDIKVHRKQYTVCCQSKSMRSSPNFSSNKGENSNNNNNNNKIERKSTDVSNNGTANVFLCEWHDCSCAFQNSEALTKHVKSEHITPTSSNDVFVCLWRDCKFSNQPSCSYKWLSKHVVGHCDLKPFKCVIFGCDMTFVTQNGLARHVPTHFNESRVRRACVITSDTKRDSLKPKRFLNASPVPCATSNEEKKERDTIERTSHSRLLTFVDQNTSLKSCKSYSSATYDVIKKKVQRGTCNPSTNSGYLDKVFRVEHKVIGRRTNTDETHEMLLTPSLNNLFPHSSFWCDAKEFRKRKHTYVDLHIKDVSEDIKNRLYDTEHRSSSRRRKKRK